MLTPTQSLQRSGTGQTLGEVLSEMFQVISLPTVDFTPLPSRCRTCAVVGNSGKLRQSGYGDQINSHDSIIRYVCPSKHVLPFPIFLLLIFLTFLLRRMNKAVTRGFEKDVGNRTTHHIIYPESAMDMKEGVSLVLLPFKLRDLEWLTSALSTGHIKMYEICNKHTHKQKRVKTNAV